ncbi:MAG: multiprotein-bridging factor 1 family protein [Candidatus Coprovivens sp.]
MEEKYDVGKIIAQARKNKKFTQQDLARLLNVSDKTVSAWETGKNYPDLGVIKNISKYLDIDLISILADKKNNTLKKILKIIFIFLIIIFVFSFLYFGIYFVNNYKKINVYEVKLDSKEYFLENGLIIDSSNKTIISLGEIINVPNDEFDVTLYGNGHEIVSKYNYDYIYYVDDVDINNLSLEISYILNDEKVSENLDLNLEKVVSNEKLFYEKKIEQEDLVSERLKVLLHNVGYKKVSNDLYEKEDEENVITYKYNLTKNEFSYYFIDNDFEKMAIYHIDSEIGYFYTYYDDYVIEEFIYQDDKMNCTLGKCNDSEKMISLLTDEYKKLK